MKQLKQGAGKWKQGLNGVNAFHPNPLPPTIDWNQDLVNALSRADLELGKLAGEARRLPNPHILLRPYARREAVYSSKIEGTQATLGEILAVEAGATVDRSPDDIREVGNYVSALEYGIQRLNEIPLSLQLMTELHGILMQGVRGETAKPGRLRTIQNWIGPLGCKVEQASYVPPPPEDIRQHLEKWESFIHVDTFPALIHTALLHYQFEAIHPFLDGNGRIGRLLITLFLCQRKIINGPFLYLSAFFESERNTYYQCLRNISVQGDWNSWLLFFLKGVAQQSRDALLRSEKINECLDGWKQKLAGKRPLILSEILTLLAVNPYITIRKIEHSLNVAYNTAAKAISVLEKADIVIPVDDNKRDRVFVCAPLLEILEDPL